MHDSFNDVLQQAHRLSRADQLTLIASLAGTMKEEELLPQAVREENLHRLEDYDAGKVQPIPYREAMQSLRGRVGAPS